MGDKLEQVDMAKEPEQKVWSLTPVEIADLMERRNKRNGVRRLLAEVAGMLGEQQEAEAEFWAALGLRINVRKGVSLAASPELGKIWIKGEVPELKQFEQRVSVVDLRG